MSKIRVLVVGCGHMGKSHAKAYDDLEDFEIVGLVSRGEKSRSALAKDLKVDCPLYSDYETALIESKPDAVCISTYPETHVEYAIKAFEAGAHVFMEKPLAEDLTEAQSVVDASVKAGKVLMVGYILRVHPSWQKFIEVARGLGKPLVMRMNLNQQSQKDQWETHKNLMNSMMPIVDCGVHYVDVMSQMTQAKPVSVYAIGARLSDELNEGQMNYGQLQVKFADGSVGWYEAGWGPMMSETAFFIKDVVGPKGSASIVSDTASSRSNSAEVEAHTKTEKILVHHSARDESGKFAKEDELLSTEDEPDHDGLCLREQKVFLSAIKGDQDLSQHCQDAIDSLRIVLAAKESIEKDIVVKL